VLGREDRMAMALSVVTAAFKPITGFFGPGFTMYLV
jgi:hypothetical protein